MPLKLCANISLLFREVEPLQRMDAARASGFEAVEIQFPYEQSLDEWQQRQSSTDIRVPLINVPAGDLMAGGEGLASVPQKRDDFRRAVDSCAEFAEGLKVDCVNVLAGRCLNDKRRLHHLDQFMHNLDYCADQMKSLGVKTVFEAINTHDMPGFLVHSVEQSREILRNINHSNLAMQYDVYHMSRMNEPVLEQLPELLFDIGHIQFADTPDRNEPGTGDLAFTEIIGLLREKEYRGWIGAEYNPSDNTDNSLGWMKTHFPEYHS